MKSLRKAAAFALSLLIAAGLSSCDSSPTGAQQELIDDIITDESVSETDKTGATEADSSEKPEADTGAPETSSAEGTSSDAAESTSAGETAPEASDTEASVTENEPVYENLTEALPDDLLGNKTVKWLSYYDPWHDRGDPYHQTAAKLFEEKYGGEIDDRYTTWNTRFNDLTVMILGGEGVDLFPGFEVIKRYYGDPMFISYDDYVDWNSPIWSSVRELNDAYAIGGKHSIMACRTDVYCMVYYSKSAILNSGYDDPWELYKNGEWTMSRFMGMLEDFTDADNERYGLGGWFNAAALSSACGLPAVSFESGRLVSNLSAPAFERSMNYQYELYQKGLVPDDLFNYPSSEDLLSEGKELFHISYFGDELIGLHSTSEPYEDITVVPLPRDDKADKYYHNASLDCYDLCRGAENPEGAVRLIECLIAAYSDKNAKAAADDHYRSEYGFTDEMIERTDEIRRLVQKEPVVDIRNVLPSDTNSLLTEMLNMPLEGTDWASAMEYANDVFDLLISETNAELDAAVN